jgi:hypothetical protein
MPEPTSNAVENRAPHTNQPMKSAADAPLPVLRAPLSVDAAVKKLDALSRQGKLAGFQSGGDGRAGVVFSAAAFSEPFDRELLATVRQADANGATFEFRLRVLPKVPLIFAAVIVLSIWPGVWLTDSMLRTYFSWYTIETWWWYLPLTILPLLWYVPNTWKKSKRMAHESALEVIAKMAKELGAKEADTK